MPAGHQTGRVCSSGLYPTRVVTSCLLAVALSFFSTARAHAAASSQIIATTSGSTVKITSVLTVYFLCRNRYDRREAVILAVEGAMKEVR